MSRIRARVACAFAVLLAASAILAAGCHESSSTGPDEADDDAYPARSHPDSVLKRLQMAYVAMDLEPYLDCLADTFQFHLLQQDWAPPDSDLPSWWGKGCEDTIHSGMFSDADTLSADQIMLTLTTETAVFEPGEPGDPHDDRWKYEMDTDLRVTLSGDLVVVANADQEFVFAIEPGRCDTLWEIVEWSEVEPWGRAEDSSWGSIKGYWRSLGQEVR
ncbi:MAG: hypothetical protein GF400_03500 [Candidatus Eisenbacteria bacterium]|nr:hypothetical protein [Candidatus Eisenbacteria bacterium]